MGLWISCTSHLPRVVLVLLIALIYLIYICTKQPGWRYITSLCGSICLQLSQGWLSISYKSMVAARIFLPKPAIITGYLAPPVGTLKPGIFRKGRSPYFKITGAVHTQITGRCHNHASDTLRWNLSGLLHRIVLFSWRRLLADASHWSCSST